MLKVCLNGGRRSRAARGGADHRGGAGRRRAPLCDGRCGRPYTCILGTTTGLRRSPRRIVAAAVSAVRAACPGTAGGGDAPAPGSCPIRRPGWQPCGAGRCCPTSRPSTPTRTGRRRSPRPCTSGGWAWRWGCGPSTRWPAYRRLAGAGADESSIECMRPEPVGRPWRRPSDILAALPAEPPPVLLHAEGPAPPGRCSPEAVRRGLHTRIGLEDTRELPDGSPAPGNPELVAAAVALGAG